MSSPTHRLPTRRRLLLAGGAALAVPSLGRPALAAPRIVRIGHINAASSQLGRACTAFAAAIAASPILSPIMRAQVHPNGALGGETEMVRACLDGTLDVTFSTSVVAGAYAPEAGLLDAAFLFRDKAHARAALDGAIGEEIAAALLRKGLPVLAWGENGPRHITANRPVRSPAELRGLKIRVPESEVMLASFRALGAAPEPLAFPQLFEALRTGRFEAQENPVSTIVAAGFERVQSHLSLTGHIYSAAFFAVAPDLLEDLDGAQRAALRDCARAGARASREAVDMAERDGVARLRAAGMAIVTDIDRPAFVAAARPALDALGARYGADLLRRIQSFGA